VKFDVLTPFQKINKKVTTRVRRALLKQQKKSYQNWTVKALSPRDVYMVNRSTTHKKTIRKSLWKS
jgi:hypothetical protein